MTQTLHLPEDAQRQDPLDVSLPKIHQAESEYKKKKIIPEVYSMLYTKNHFGIGFKPNATVPKSGNLHCIHKVTLQHLTDIFQSTASAKQMLQR